jgi:hypothetical protein
MKSNTTRAVWWLRKYVSQQGSLSMKNYSWIWTGYNEGTTRVCRVTVSEFSLFVEIKALPWNENTLVSMTVPFPAEESDVFTVLRGAMFITGISYDPKGS